MCLSFLFCFVLFLIFEHQPFDNGKYLKNQLRLPLDRQTVLVYGAIHRLNKVLGAAFLSHPKRQQSSVDRSGRKLEDMDYLFFQKNII